MFVLLLGAYERPAQLIIFQTGVMWRYLQMIPILAR